MTCKTNVEKFYKIIAEKTTGFGTKASMLRHLGFSEAELKVARTRLVSDEKAGRLPPVGLMIKLDSLFDSDFLAVCLREKMDSPTIGRKSLEVAQNYLDEIKMVEQKAKASESDRRRRLKRRLVREMYLEKSFSI